MISTIPKERNQPQPPAQLQRLTSPLEKKVQVEILKKKEGMVSAIPKERNQPHQPPAQLQKLTSPLEEKVQVEIYKEKRND